MTTSPSRDSTDTLAVEGDRPLPTRRIGRTRTGRLRFIINGPSAVAVIILVAGLVISQSNYLLEGSVALAYAVAATGLGLALGLAGEFMLGQLFLFAVGAYVTAVLIQPAYGWNYWTAAIAGVVGATIVGLVMSVMALRVSRFYFALIGFFLVSLAPNFVTIIPQTGGTQGLPVATVPSLFGHQLGNKGLFFLAGAALVISLLLARNIREAPLGVQMRRMRENPVTLKASGIPIWRVRIPTYVLCSMLAGVGGAIYCELYAYLQPTFFDLNTTVLLFAAVLVGGATTLLGPAIGIVLLYIIPTAVINIQGYSQFVYGGIILVSVILFPGGVEQAVVDRYKQRRARTRRERLEVELPAMEQPLRSGERRTAVAAANRGDLQISLAHMLRALREDVQPAGEIVVRGAVKRFGGVAALDFEAGDSISVVPGKVHLLLGPNGSGKTTLLNATSGLTRLDSGTVTIGELTVTKHAPARIARMGVSRSFQGPSLPPELTPRELLGASLAHMRNVSYVHWVTSNPIAARVRQAARAQAGEILTAAGLGAAIDEPCSRLTSGQTRTVDVIMALTSRSTLVMLDEPAAGLSEIERRRLAETIRALAESGIGFLVVEHDMELAFGLADHVTVLGQGRIIASGAPDEIKEDQQVREVLIGPTG